VNNGICHPKDTDGITYNWGLLNTKKALSGYFSEYTQKMRNANQDYYINNIWEDMDGFDFSAH
jgi:hypothetical protein